LFHQRHIQFTQECMHPKMNGVIGTTSRMPSSPALSSNAVLDEQLGAPAGVAPSACARRPYRPCSLDEYSARPSIPSRLAHRGDKPGVILRRATSGDRRK